MREKRTALALKEVAKLRALQRLAAEARAAHAANAFHEDDVRYADEERRGAAIEREWHRLLAEPAMAMDLMPLYSAAWLRQETVVAEARARRADALARAEYQRMQWRESMMRDDAAIDLARSAARDWHRRRDEKALQDMADRFAGQEHRR